MIRPLLALLAALSIAAPALAQSASPNKAAPAAPAQSASPNKAAPAAKDPVVARVNGEELHRSEVLSTLQTLPQQVQQMPIEQVYPRLLNEMVINKVISQAGRKSKLSDDPEVKRRTLQAQDQIIEDVYLQRYVRAGITEAKIKARYDTYLKTVKPQDQVSARHILVKTEDEAKAIVADLKKGADFATLAKDKSTDTESKASGGDLGWFAKEEMVPEFGEAAFKLQKGQFSETPVKSQFGYHIIKVEDRRAAPPPTLEQAKPEIVQLLQRDLVNQKVQELKSAAKVEMFAMDGSALQPPPQAAPTPAPGPAPAPAPAPNGAPPTLNLQPLQQPQQ